MQIKSHKEDIQAYHDQVGDYRVGKRNTKPLLYGREGRPDNYKLGFGGAGSGEDWTTPRHRHTFEQIRYVASGEYVIRKDEVLPTGWLAYFPESCFYGPQIKRADCDMMTLQFGGPSGLGYWSTAERKKAFDSMLKKGAFEDGMFVWTDENGKKHRQDAGEAVEAEARGEAVDYPTPRYNDIIIMNPEAFSWVNDAEHTGVARKLLGSFTERDIRVEFVRLEKGASLDFGLEKSNEVMFLKEGALTHDNTRYEEHTGFGMEPEDQPVTLHAVEPSELVYIKMPTF
jgi:hypothetical protein